MSRELQQAIVTVVFLGIGAWLLWTAYKLTAYLICGVS